MRGPFDRLDGEVINVFDKKVLHTVDSLWYILIPAEKQTCRTRKKSFGQFILTETNIKIMLAQLNIM